MKYIYLRTNIVNGKQYVGQTSNIEKRNTQWGCLKLKYANNDLTKDREKYGLNNWVVDVLKECNDSEGDYWEQYYIKELNTKYPNGYNMNYGGKGNNGFKHSEESKIKMSENLKGKNAWNKGLKGIHFSPKTEFKKGHTPWIKGGHHTKETVEKLSKKVYQYTFDGELVKVWKSTMECGRNGYNATHVGACCRGERKTHKGYKWSYIPL